MFRLFIKNCNVDENGSVAMWQHMFVFMWCVLRYGVSCSSTLQFFINNLNILSIVIVKWKQLNKERIPDDDQ